MSLDIWVHGKGMAQHLPEILETNTINLDKLAELEYLSEDLAFRSLNAFIRHPDVATLSSNREELEKYWKKNNSLDT